MNRILALLILMISLTMNASAQEKIYLKTQKAPLEGTITEIGVNEIKYVPADAQQLVMVLEKQDVLKIVFKSGRVQYFTDPMQDFNYYKGQRHNIAKVGLLSPIFGFTDLYLEHSVKPGRSVEYQANIIGLGKRIYDENRYGMENQYIDQRGAAVGAGIKFVRVPDFNNGTRLKLQHILQGGYIKPAIMLGYYQRNFIAQDPLSPWGSYYKTERKGVFTSNISITLGKQWILDNTFSIEIYGNLGIGIDNYRKQQEKFIQDNQGGGQYINENNTPYPNFGFTRFGRDDVGLTIGGGLKVGYLFNWKKPTESEREIREIQRGAKTE